MSKEGEDGETLYGVYEAHDSGAYLSGEPQCGWYMSVDGIIASLEDMLKDVKTRGVVPIPPEAEV